MSGLFGRDKSVVSRHIKNVFDESELDKKAVAGELKFILPERIGKVRIQKGIKESLIREALKTN